MSHFFNKLKKRWGVENYGQVILILFIFSITGMSALYVRRLMFDVIGITPDTAFWVKTIAWLIIVFPAYQILFLLYGFLLGQFEFVWRFEKKSLKRIKTFFQNKR